MLDLLYTCKVQVVNWPAGVSPVGPDFGSKELKTDELKALVGPYLRRCMGSDYDVEVARDERQEPKKRKKNDKWRRVKVKMPDEELMFVPWSDGESDSSLYHETTNLNLDRVQRIIR